MENDEVFTIRRPLDISVGVGGIAIEGNRCCFPTGGGPQEYITGLYERDPLLIRRKTIQGRLTFPAAFDAARDETIIFCRHQFGCIEQLRFRAGAGIYLLIFGCAVGQVVPVPEAFVIRLPISFNIVFKDAVLSERIELASGFVRF